MGLLAQVVADACVKAGLTSMGGPIPPNIGDYAVRECNRMLGQWNIQPLMIWSESMPQFEMTPRPPAWDPDQTWYTIGPVAEDPNVDFNVTARPVRIDKANLVLTNSPAPVGPQVIPIRIYDYMQWGSVSTPQLGVSNYPTALYCDYDFPIAKIFLNPFPTIGGNYLQLFYRQTLAEFAALGDSFTMPPGYEDAFMLTLAERLPRGLRDPDPALERDAAFARAAVKSNNNQSPKISTADSGTPRSRRGGQGNFYSGWPSS